VWAGVGAECWADGWVWVCERVCVCVRAVTFSHFFSRFASFLALALANVLRTSSMGGAFFFFLPFLS
jgi:hypothetical protein